MSNVVAVLGYGCQPTEDLKRYLEAVAMYVKAEGAARIFCTGGNTSAKNAHVSEASMMVVLLGTILGRERLVCDHEAITTQENLRALRRYLRKRPQLAQAQLVIFCDATHALKVYALCLLILWRWPVVKTVPIISGWKAVLTQYCICTPFDIIACVFPPFHWLRRAIRRWQIARS